MLPGSSKLHFDWTSGALAEGLRCYGAGEFFAAHEAWEEVWLQLREPEKTFLQGLIQVTAAFHHLQRENQLGATRLLRAALGRLESYPEDFGGISLGVVREDIRQRLSALEAAEPASPLAPVRIEPSLLSS